MKRLLLVGSALAASLCFANTSALPRSSPEAQGVSSAAILAFIETAEREIDALHSIMLVRHGHVIAEGWWAPYSASLPHTLFSLSKSFTSTAVGLAVAEGHLSVDDPVLRFFPADSPVEPSEHLKQMRVRDLLMMSTGQHYTDLQAFSFQGPERLTKAFLHLPVAHKPGTHFVYNTPATYMLSAIVQQVTGETLLDYLRPRLFEPMGIEGVTSSESPQGVTLGGYGMAMRTEDIARFGQLYLQKGQWRGQQLLPASWVADATARQTSNGSNPDSDWEQGYGYQFWRCRHGLYRGDGAFGQYCIVFPEHDAVIAITSGVRDMGAVMNLIWARLLPALQPQPLATDDAAQQRLAQKLSSLALPTPAGAATSPLGPRLAGKRFALPPNPQGIDRIEFDFTSVTPTITTWRNGLAHRIGYGHGRWQLGRSSILPELGNDPVRQREQSVAATGAWTNENTYVAHLCLNETPYIVTSTFTFDGDSTVSLQMEQNVAFGPRQSPLLTAHAE